MYSFYRFPLPSVQTNVILKKKEKYNKKRILNINLYKNLKNNQNLNKE